MLCLGCGQDIVNVREFLTDALRHVVPLWASLMEDEYRARRKSDVHQLLDRAGDGRLTLCRQCFATFERASTAVTALIAVSNPFVEVWL